MNGAHLHLILNHLPVVGTLFLLFVLIAGLLQNSPQVHRSSLAFAVLVGMAAAAAYLTGEPAEEVIMEQVPGIAESVIEAHEEFAEIAFAVTALLGAMGVAGLVVFRRPNGPPALFMAAVLVVAVVAAGAMAYTANLGGDIRHPEIHSQPMTAPVPVTRR